MNAKMILKQLHEIAASPDAQLKKYLAEGKKVVAVAPVYTPNEIIHSMGLVPMGVWGADVELKEAKKYFPAFICSVMQSILELGVNGTYDGISAIVIPSLCDSLKVLGQNWKYAVKDIPFIPMTYPQNRKPAYALDFTRACYQRVIDDLTKATGAEFSDEALKKSIAVYNAHNAAMRDFEIAASYAAITAAERSDVFKSALFMLPEEHTELVKELTEELKAGEQDRKSLRILVSGIQADAPDFLQILDDLQIKIAWDDVAQESRQYYTDAPEGETGLDSLARKFSDMDHCSLLYDRDKKRVDFLIENAKKTGAEAVVVLMTKFCDPEEFDYVPIKKACQAQGLICVNIEVDRQMKNFAQARTALETLKEAWM